REEREAGKQRQHRCDEASHPTHIPNLSGSLANDESAGHVLALPFVVAGSGCRPPWPPPARRRSPKGRSIGANNVRFALGPDDRPEKRGLVDAPGRLPGRTKGSTPSCLLPRPPASLGSRLRRPPMQLRGWPQTQDRGRLFGGETRAPRNG